MKKSIFISLFVLALQVCSLAQVPVVLAPPPKLQFFDASGRPLSFGCVFTYASGTNTPITTYTDHTGVTVNANPVPLNGGGFAGGGSSGIWLQAGVAYTLKVVSHGGTNCAFGQTQYTIDGIGGSGSQQSTTETCNGACPFTVQSEVQLFIVNLTGNSVGAAITAVGITTPGIISFEIVQGGGNTFIWPSNSIGGCVVASGVNVVTTQMFIWDGTNARAVGPCVTGNGPVLGSFTVPTVTATTSISSPFFDASAGYKIGGSYGTANYCLQSTGSGTQFSSVCSPGGTPTFTAGVGAGTSPTITFLAGSTDKMGTIQVTTGTVPPNFGNVVTINFSTPFPTAAFCVFSQEGTAGEVIPFMLTTGVSTSSFSLYNQGPPALTAARAYLWNYLCNGY